MDGKILVTYATQAGSTREIAEAIAQTLTASGASVDVLPMRDVQDLSLYRAVVAGSAIHGQKWLPEGMKFLRVHQAALRTKPFAAFMVCITLGSKYAAQYRAGIMGWLDPVRSMVKPVSEGFFAGNLDFSRLPLTLNTILLRLAVALGALPKGDFRDWNAIRAWAETTRPLLLH